MGKPLSLFRGYVSDLDDTLVASEVVHLQLKKLVCARHGIRVPDEAWPEFHARKEREVFTELIARYGGDGVTAEQLRDEKREIFMVQAPLLVRPIPGALELLREVKLIFERVALTTTSAAAVTEMMLQTFGLADLFDVVVTGDDVTQCKPAPEPYLKTAQLLRLAPKDCLVVEDSVSGVRSALGAGCHVIGLATSTSADTLLDAGVDFIAANYEDVWQIVHDVMV